MNEAHGEPQLWPVSMGDWFSSVVVALLQTPSLSASITPSCRQNQLSSGWHEIPFIYPITAPDPPRRIQTLQIYTSCARSAPCWAGEKRIARQSLAYIRSRWHGRLYNQSKHVLQFPSALKWVICHLRSAATGPDE
ncbi:hypothetical protein EV363DRAFT_1346446 [Boletus edulis]|nr:hypothetical protein EV363DRAFT_1346446 [Boletus edulis]